MDNVAIAIEASLETTGHIQDLARARGVGCSDPVALGSVADALDAPIGGEELKSLLELATLIFKAGAGMFAFFVAVRDYLRSRPPGESVSLRVPTTGNKIGRIDAETTDAQINEMIAQ